MAMIGPIYVNYSDFTAAATSDTLDLVKRRLGLNSGRASVTGKVRARVLVPFAGPGLAAATISVGISGSATKYSSARSVMAAADTDYTDNTPGADAQAAQLRFTLALTGCNANALTAGKVAYWIEHETLNL